MHFDVPPEQITRFQRVGDNGLKQKHLISGDVILFTCLRKAKKNGWGKLNRKANKKIDMYVNSQSASRTYYD